MLFWFNVAALKSVVCPTSKDLRPKPHGHQGLAPLSCNSNLHKKERRVAVCGIPKYTPRPHYGSLPFRTSSSRLKSSDQHKTNIAEAYRHQSDIPLRHPNLFPHLHSPKTHGSSMSRDALAWLAHEKDPCVLVLQLR